MSQQGEEERPVAGGPPGSPEAPRTFRGVLKRIALTRIPLPTFGISILSRRFLKCFLVAWAAVFILSSLHWRTDYHDTLKTHVWRIGWPFVYGGQSFDRVCWYIDGIGILGALCLQIPPAFAVAVLYLVGEKLAGRAAARWPGLLCPANSPDRRRFESLAGEIILARLGGSVIAAALIASLGVVCKGFLFYLDVKQLYWGQFGLFSSAVTLFLFLLVCSFPTALAKRGWRPAALTVLAATGAYIVASAGCEFLPAKDVFSGYPVMKPVAQFGSIATAIAVVEGNFERSIATVFAGLLLGPLVGAWAGILFVFVFWKSSAFTTSHMWWYHAMLSHWHTVFLAAFSLTVVLQTGVGLSLYLGRRIRNW